MRYAVILAAVAAVACGSATDVKPKVDTVPIGYIPCGPTVSPASLDMHVGDVATFTAGSCVTGGVWWASSAPAVATADSLSGQVRAVGAGVATIIATSKLDPTVKGAAVVSVAGASTQPTTLVVIQTINEVGPPSVPANLNSVNNAIDVAVQVTSPFVVRDIRLVANDGVRDSTVARDTTRIAPRSSTPVHLFWNTKGFANGGYRLSVVTVDSVGFRAASSFVQLTVFNP